MSLTKQTLHDIVEENDLSVQGDETLLSITKKSQFSKEQMSHWYNELTTHSH